ncbi:MAG: DUF4190 domain-containing protein, partial [Nitriliruptoraceae bacterium]
VDVSHAAPPPPGSPPPPPPPGGPPSWGAGGAGRPPPAGDTPATNGAALAAVIIGVVSLVLAVMGFAVLPLFLAVPGALAAIVLGVVGRRRARQGAPRAGQALAGLVTGIAGLVIAGIWIGLLFVLGGQFLEEFSDELTELQACIEETGDQDLCTERFSDEVLERLDP